MLFSLYSNDGDDVIEELDNEKATKAYYVPSTKKVDLSNYKPTGYEFGEDCFRPNFDFKIDLIYQTSRHEKSYTLDEIVRLMAYQHKEQKDN